MKAFIFLILSSLFLYLCLHLAFPKLEPIHALIYGLNIASLLQLVGQLGKKLVFAEFLSFSAITLWLSIPLIMWDTGTEKLMIPNLFGSEILDIPKNTYYNWALPATLGLILGLNMFQLNKEKIIFQFNDLTGYLNTINRNTPKILFVIGAVAITLGRFVPASLGFLFFLCSQFIFIAVLYCLFGNFSYSKWIYFGASALSLIGVASSGMFGELVWWGLIIVIYFLIKYPMGLIKKFILLVSGIFIISTLQTIKNEYRRLTWSTKNSTEEAGLKLLGKTTWNSMFGTARKNTKATSRIVLYRMNHAYTVSRVMKYVPKKEPFANGETIFGSLIASFVPRILWPDKPKSGGHENMKRFARFDPHGGASYDIGQIGDAWANFGYWGGIIFLFSYGLLNSWLLKGLFHYAANSYQSIILWIPVVFLQLLKVEVSVLTNFNAAIKGAFFIALVFFIFKKLGIKL